ncbi:MAG: hypothetical protein J5530_04350, partial [Clostridia bacterium]|nr:hypothetical protein [Clostridia bacterium]
MRRALTALLCIVLVASMILACGCGGNNDTPASSAPDNSSENNSEQGNSGEESGFEPETSDPAVP